MRIDPAPRQLALVALCDCCGLRPGTALIDTGALAGETWACDMCRGIVPEADLTLSDTAIRQIVNPTPEQLLEAPHIAALDALDRELLAKERA